MTHASGGAPRTLRGRLRGERQGAAPPGPPICTAEVAVSLKTYSQIAFLRNSRKNKENNLRFKKEVLI